MGKVGTGWALAAVAVFLVQSASAVHRIDVRAGESLSAVRDAVRRLSPTERENGVEVVLAAGEYFVPGGIEFLPCDGGTVAAPVVWRATEGGKVRLVGAHRVPIRNFRKVTDKAMLRRLPAAARARVVCADVSDLLPGDVPELPKSFTGAPTPPVLLYANEFATLARWPNDGWASFTQAVDKGTCVSKEAYPGTYRNGAFVFSGGRARRWDFGKGVWFCGYWTHDWYENSIRGGSYGAENGTNDVIRLDGDMRYGVMGGTWGRKDRRFRAFNLPEELDAPGEWWLDRKRKVVYLIPPNGRFGTGDEVYLAMSEDVLLRGKGVRFMCFEGLSLSHNYGGLVSFSDGSSDIGFVGCRFANVLRHAVFLDGCRFEVRNCELFNCGAAGIVLSGGDRRKLVGSGSVVENCRIHRFGVLQRTYAPGISIGGIGMTIRGNEIFDAPHSAVIYGGNEHLFESNDVHHVVLETGDAGAFYTGRDWTSMGNVLRYNFVHELGSQDTDANAMGFYFDDCDCGDEVFGNVFWRVARGIMIGGGREHPVRNNVFAECQIGLSIDNRGMNWKVWNTPDNGWNLEEKAERIGYRQEPWKSRYPRLARIMEDSPREPLYNPVCENVFLDCTKAQVALEGKAVDGIIPKLVFSNNVIVASSPSAKAAASDARIASGFATVTNVVPCGVTDLRIRRLLPGVADCLYFGKRNRKK